MTDVERIFITASVTIVGGVLVFVIGQLLSRFFIEPVQDLKKAIGEARFTLAFFSPIIHTPISRTPERSDEAYAAVMKSSCELLAKAEAVAWYRVIPNKFLSRMEAVNEAAVNLRALSTYLHETGDKAAGHIEQMNSRVARVESLLSLQPLK